MEVAGNAVGIDLGKRTYKMCIISRRDREEILPPLKGYEKDEAGRLAERLDLIEKQTGELYKKINEEVEKDDKVQKIMTVPGIGPITELSYVAYVGDVGRFENAHQISNFICHDSEEIRGASLYTSEK